MIDVLQLFKRRIIKSPEGTVRLNNYDMFKNYFTVGWRNLLKNKGYSLLNIGGLSVGLTVAVLIGLWVWDEINFNKSFTHHDRLAKVWQFVKFDVEKSSYDVLPIPLADELRDKYPDFEKVSLSVSRNTIISNEAKTFIKTGNYVQPSFVEMMSVDMISGTGSTLKETNSILLSESLAKSFFGSEDPLNKQLTLDGAHSVTVTGIFADFPPNSTFNDVTFLASWEFQLANNANVKRDKDQWDSNSYNIFVQVRDGAQYEPISAKIKDIRMQRSDPPGYKPEFFLHPMSKWHLYGDFKNGKNTGGLIEYVWVFGIIGIFVLILACINFMNLATARSEKRAKEVGIRKSIGSARSQLIFQFLTESFLIVMIGFLLSLVIVQLSLPLFNQMAGKTISVPWSNPYFWICGLSFSMITALFAGSYPALYLSSFLPVKVLKGTFKASRFAGLPRKVLVVVQFTVSVTMMIGFIIIYRQIEFAKGREVGYDRSRLIEVSMNGSGLAGHFDELRNALLRSGAVEEMSESTGSVTLQYDGTTAVSWQGKAAGTKPLLMANRVTHEYGKTIGWQILEGRDFSRDYSTDSAAIIINEAALKLMMLKNPLGERVNYIGSEFQIIGIIKDMVKESPFEPVKPTFYILNYKSVDVINLKLSSQMETAKAISKVESVLKQRNPAAPFEYTFVDDKYREKFSHEERVGKLASFFAVLAMFISSLGIIGLASFTAAQRTKEIGIKKVMGATVFQLWQMLSKDFVSLVVVSVVLSAPIAWYFMSKWLMRFQYRAELLWWIFAVAGFVALTITLLTVSYQSIRAAIANPVNSLRSE